MVGERLGDHAVGQWGPTETRDEGDGDPGSRELDERGEVGILGDHARHRAEVGEDAHERLVADRAARRARPRLIDEIPPIELAAVGERMSHRQHDIGFVVAEMLGDDMRRRHERHGVPVVHDGEVDDTGRDHSHRVDRIDARHGRVRRRLGGSELTEHRTDEPSGGRRERGDAQRCRGARSARGERLESFEPVEERSALARERTPLLGEEHPPATALEEGGGELAFEALDLLRDGGRGVPELLGRGDHGTRAVDGDERTKAERIDHEAIVRIPRKEPELVLDDRPCHAGSVAPRHLLLGILVALVWGVNFVAIEFGLTDTPPLVLVALRFVFVALPLVFFVPKPDVSWRVIAGIGLFMSAGQFGLLFTAMHLGLPAGLAAVVLQCQMVFTLIIGAVVLHERPTRMQLVGAALAVIGLGVVALGRADAAAGLVAIVPVLICVAAGLSWGVGNVISRSAAGANGFSIVVWSALVVPLPMVGLSLLLDGPAVFGDAVMTIGWETVASVAYTAGLASLVGYTIWNMLLGRYPASVVAPFALLVPPVGLAAAWLLLGEVPNGFELAGSVVLVGGVAIGQLRRRPTAPVAASTPDSPQVGANSNRGILGPRG